MFVESKNYCYLVVLETYYALFLTFPSSSLDSLGTPVWYMMDCLILCSMPLNLVFILIVSLSLWATMWFIFSLVFQITNSFLRCA